jgi:two-component system, response regulator
MTTPYILLVEDNPDDEELTRIAFRKARISNELVVAHDGAEALETLFPEHTDRAAPMLVMLDLNLPKVEGVEVLRRIRAEPKTTLTPVIILTSSRQQEDIVTTYQLRANAYVRKPVAFDEFAEAVRVLGLFWLVINEPPPVGIQAPASAAGSFPPRLQEDVKLTVARNGTDRSTPETSIP